MREALTAFLGKQGFLDSPAPDTAAVLRACIAYLGASPARAVLVNWEDLWLEGQGQNVPGDSHHPNWQRKARHGLESFSQLAEVLAPLRALNHLRHPEGDAQ
jgi:4-alpha-glucanotransferase